MKITLMIYLMKKYYKTYLIKMMPLHKMKMKMKIKINHWVASELKYQWTKCNVIFEIVLVFLSNNGFVLIAIIWH